MCQLQWPLRLAASLPSIVTCSNLINKHLHAGAVSCHGVLDPVAAIVEEHGGRARLSEWHCRVQVCYAESCGEALERRTEAVTDHQRTRCCCRTTPARTRPT